jgi:hypothetical protein
MSADTVDLMITIFIFSAILPFIFGIFNWLYGWKLMFYIKRRNPYRYQYLWGNTFAGLGDPISNFLIVWRYIYSDEDEEDDFIKDYKKKLRISIKLFLISGLLMMLSGVLLSIVAYFDESNMIGWFSKQALGVSRSLHELITI